MKKQEKICKEYQNLSLLEINVTGKDWINHQENMTWKKIQKNNPAIALLLTKKNKYISCLHFTKHNYHGNQIILSMIPNG